MDITEFIDSPFPITWFECRPDLSNDFIKKLANISLSLNYLSISGLNSLDKDQFLKNINYLCSSAVELCSDVFKLKLNWYYKFLTYYGVRVWVAAQCSFIQNAGTLDFKINSTANEIDNLKKMFSINADIIDADKFKCKVSKIENQKDRYEFLKELFTKTNQTKIDICTFRKTLIESIGAIFRDQIKSKHRTACVGFIDDQFNRFKFEPSVKTHNMQRLEIKETNSTTIDFYLSHNKTSLENAEIFLLSAINNLQKYHNLESLLA